MRSHNRPKADVFRCISVGIVLMAASTALEVQALAVGRGDESTLRAASRCVLGIDQLKSNAMGGCLILDKELPLSVWPAVDFGPEVFPFLERTVSDVAQVFNDDPLRSDTNRVADQLFRRKVEQRIRYGCLVPGHPSQESPGGLGANGLDGGAGAPDARTAVVKPTAFEEKCFGVAGVGGGHQAFHAKVHANHTTIIFEFRDLNLVGEDKIPLLPDAFNLGILPSRLRDTGANQFDWFSENGHALFVSGEVPSVSHRHGRFPVYRQFPAIVGFCGLVGGGNLTEKGASQLRRNLEFIPNRPVELLLEFSRIEFFHLENNWRQPVQCVKIPDTKSVVMLHVPGKLDLGCSDCFQ